MTVNGLKAVLEAGRKDRAVYYKQRVDRFRGDQVRCSHPVHAYVVSG